jgi:opacity protein-like surface antigen
VDTDGLTFGLGVEYNVTERLFLGADLSRRDLSGASGFEAEIDTPCAAARRPRDGDARRQRRSP